MTRSRRFLFAAGLLVALLGWFVVSGPPASSPDIVQRGQPIDGGRATAIRLRRSVGSLSGRVTDGDGAPLARALVCAAHAANHALGRVDSLCARTTHEGSYLIPDLTAGAYDVSAILEGYMPSSTTRQRDVVVLPGPPTRGVDFVLERGGARLAGTVIDATGGPIEGASLALWFGEPAFRKVMIESDAEGRFAAWVTPGSVGVTVSAEGYAQALASHVAPSSDLVIRLTPGSTIRGTVVSLDRGAPVSGVDVRAVCHYCFSSAGSPAAVSGEGGRFEIRDLDAAIYEVTAEGDAWRGQAQDVVPVGLAQTVEGVLVVVSPVFEVVGKVERTDGEPCLRGTVMLEPPRSESAAPALPVLAAGIEASGVVRFRSVPKGSYQASVQCENHVQADGPAIVAVADGNVEGLLWRVKPGLQLNVNIVDAAGRPRPNTYFALSMPSPSGDPSDRMSMMLMTDANGRHEVQPNLRPGTYRVEPYNADGDPVTVELREGVGPVEATLRLSGSGTLEVSVHTSDRTPIDSVRVIAMASESPAASPPSKAYAAFRKVSARQATMLGDGLFQFASIKPGIWEVEVDDGLNAPLTRTVQVGEGVSREVFVLDRGRVIRGRVLDADGQPQRDVWVSATCATSEAPEPAADSGDLAVRVLRESKRVVSDARGEFTLTHVSRAATACTVRAHEPGGSVGETKNVVPGQDAVVSMRALGALSGTARTADGRAVQQFMVSVVTDEKQSRSEMVSSTGGSWKLAQVIPGHLKLSARTTTGEVAEQTLELAPGQALHGVQLEFAAAPGPPAAIAN